MRPILFKISQVLIPFKKIFSLQQPLTMLISSNL